MRGSAIPALAGRMLLLLSGASLACASEPQRLLEGLNAYRAQVQLCAGEASELLPPLRRDGRLDLPLAAGSDLKALLSASGYPMSRVQSINLSGPREAGAALQVLKESFCQVLLDPQFVDIGVSQVERDWRIVLARPLLKARQAGWEEEGRRLLEQINAARAQPRQCGEQSFAAAQPLLWQASLGLAAEGHSRAMATGNYFAHRDREGRTPGDRAELAGYSGGLVGENIAAGLASAQEVVAGWLASPAHCATLMGGQFRVLGAAYAVAPDSDAGIYWTALFAAP